MYNHTIKLAFCISSVLYCSTSATAAPNTEAITKLDTVTVTGYRASLEKTQSIKRAANSIVDAISAEDIGKFPDSNAAESLSHLPGISVDRQFGEGEKISINGTDPALNRVLLNGQTIASGDWGGNPTDTSGRTFNYSLLSPEIIGLMEVYKTPEARIDEGSIGGTVIVHTRQPLDLPKNTIRGSIGYSYNDRSKKSNPRGSILWSWKNDSENFGALISATHDKQDIARAGIEFFGYTTGANIPPEATITGDGSTPTAAKVPAGINSAFFQQTRERNGLQGALQWKPNEQNEFNLTGIYIKGKYNNFSESRYICPACNNDLNKASAANVQNGYITTATVSDGTAGQPYAQLDANYRISTVTTNSLNLHHQWSGDKWVLTTQTGTTKATGGKDPEYLMKFLLQEGGYRFNYDGTHTGVTYDNNNASNWALKSGEQAGGLEYTRTNDQENYFQFDATRDLHWGPFNKLQFGYKYIGHKNGQTSRGNALFANQDILLTAFNPGMTPTGLYNGLGASGDLINWPTADLRSVLSYLNALPEAAFETKYNQQFSVTETTNNLYTQLDFDSGKWRGNLGIRYVDTKDNILYWQSTTVNDTVNYQPVKDSKRYYKPLPSLNIAYDLTNNSVLRFSAARVIARPRYGDLAGSFSLNSTSGDLTASGGNPNLKPYQSSNYDLAAEWYFAPSSMLSAEAFYRDISSYIVTTTTTETLSDPSNNIFNKPYTVTRPMNATGAKVTGLSLNYQHAFAYGFGLATNYTYAQSNSNDGLNLPYLSKNTYNVIPYWEKGPWAVRLNYSYRSKYFTQIGRLDSQVFTDAYKELDLTTSYKFNDWVTLNISATNLLNSTYYWYNEVKYAPIGMYKNGRSYQAQLNFKF
ncbi:TonB-dependent receptor [Xylella fastidiosa]|uniref:TonB-dependent receptor n=1 Tax=Xylella fastidiosa TaxID=2371 RepID=UPI0009004570|nr:TonB-dependent receptor [Xylella fastidiosa]MDD0929020.1 TonB-dependent receptor [Xylella fastidiosa subsp. multiplex]QTX27932.1 TonB-dependent receptor [Xylella fastidiosa subsp. multiplex]TNV90845.1 TonB-dependent receptor [Xylella fastidiosa]TNW00864.1 TonB-dependent receptor [Xylella fastidiosa]UIT41203.1 TonB-dependent receptor [Xylella fastidiosa subsp. multiplex]